MFVDVTGSPDRLLELTAQAGAASAMMGDTLRVPAGATADFKVHAVHANCAEVQVLLDGEPAPLLKDNRVGAEDQWLASAWTGDGKPHWIRIDVRGADGKLILLGNPIYLK